MSERHEPGDDALEVTTPAGATVDLAPLVAAAQGIRRNALRDAEHEVETGVSRQTVSYITFGMRIAVLNLFGTEAAQRFEDAVEGNRQGT